MNRSLVMLAVLPLALTLAACEGPPAGEDVGASAEVTGAQVVLKTPIGIKPLPTSALIDFDNSPAGPVASNTMINSTYASSGVQLSCVVCASGNAYAIFGATTGSNAVSLWQPPSVPEFDARAGAVKAAFSTPRSWVSIEATPILPAEFLGTPTSRPFLEAFDAQGNLIGSVVYYPYSYGDPNFGTTQVLKVSSSTANIAYVLFSSQAPGGNPPVYGLFDNLRYSVPLPVLFP